MANMNNMGQFSGDMDRNEVEIDLPKFMALLQEKSELKDRIRELEDVNNVNPYQKWIFLAQMVDSWRIFPRVFLSVYIFLLCVYPHGILHTCLNLHLNKINSSNPALVSSALL